MSELEGPSQPQNGGEGTSEGPQLDYSGPDCDFLTQRQFYTWLSSPMDIAKKFALVPDSEKAYHCPKCFKVLKFRSKKNSFRCVDMEIAFFQGTWFEGSKLSMESIFEICWAFCEDETYDWCVKNIYGHRDTQMSPTTVARWYDKCREVIFKDMLAFAMTNGQLDAIAQKSEKEIVRAWKRVKKENSESLFKALLMAISRQFMPNVVTHLREPTTDVDDS